MRLIDALDYSVNSKNIDLTGRNRLKIYLKTVPSIFFKKISYSDQNFLFLNKNVRS